jgi:proteic killer suppression protein
MIQSFNNKRLKALFESGVIRGLPADLVERITRRLDVLNAAAAIQDINLPGYRLHQLKGDRKGTWSISVSGNWRLTFRFSNGDAFDVDLEDYH